MKKGHDYNRTDKILLIFFTSFTCKKMPPPCDDSDSKTVVTGVLSAAPHSVWTHHYCHSISIDAGSSEDWAAKLPKNDLTA